VTSTMTRLVTRLLLLPTLVTALAILVKGYTQPGDGFSAGVVAALGVLLQLMVFGREEAEKIPGVRQAGALAFVGLLAALALAFVPLLFGEAVLTHYPPPGGEVAHFGTLEFITAVLFDCAVFLLVFGFVVGTVGALSRVAEEGEEAP
jgi:multicomponent Na+:H+ antiporter subunit B